MGMYTRAMGTYKPLQMQLRGLRAVRIWGNIDPYFMENVGGYKGCLMLWRMSSPEDVGCRVWEIQA